MRWARDGLKAYTGKLRAAGVQVVPVLPMRSLSAVLKGKSARFDLRNHRKIVVLDGTVGYIGSQNIVDAESMPGLANQELVARVTGPVVSQLQAVFLADRYLESRRQGSRRGGDFRPLAPDGPSIAQMLPSGPGYGTQNAQMVLVSMIHNAVHRVGSPRPTSYRTSRSCRRCT
ncbi:hypothetical protein ACTMU2_38370 [Cupriavidus basilensis]